MPRCRVKGDVAREQVESRCMLHLPTAPHGRTRGTPVAQGDPAGTLMPRGGRGGAKRPRTVLGLCPARGPRTHVAMVRSRCMLHLPMAPHGRTRGAPAAQKDPPGTPKARGACGGGETPAHGARVMPHLGPRTDMAMATHGGSWCATPHPGRQEGAGRPRGRGGGGGGGGGAHSATRGRAHRPGC